MSQFHLINVALCSTKFPYIEEKGIKEALSKETGRERIIRMYSKSEMGIMSPELQYVVRSASTLTVFAAFFGALAQMNKTKEDFLRKNVASLYESQHLGRRALVDTLTINGIKGAYKSAIKYGSFSSLYLLSTMTVENYYNKFSIWEHMGSGGGLVRCNFGVKGMLVSGALGGVLGSIAGGLVMLNMWISGVSMEDFRYWQHELYYSQAKKKKAE